MKEHVLVIGGSGMLTGTVKWLSEEGYLVSVIGRTKKKMKSVLKYKNVMPIYVDYHNTELLKEKINEQIETFGEIGIVVAWIHSSGKYALNTIMKRITREKKNVDLYHILGSATNLEKVRQSATAPTNCNYYQILLGYIQTGSRTRWLTHTEISEGVIEALQHQTPSYIIGTIDDWNNRR